MSFKKLNPLLKEALLQQGYSKPLPFQKEILPKLKGGANVYGIAPKRFGKTTALIMAIVHKLTAEAVDESPRPLVMVKDKEAALDAQEQFEVITNQTNPRF